MPKKDRSITTAKDFAAYRKHCENYLKTFGLTDWEVEFAHRDFIDSRTLAGCSSNAEGRCATLILTKDWNGYPVSSVEIKNCARHEVLHLLLASLMSLARTRNVTEDSLVEAEHAVVRRLERLL